MTELTEYQYVVTIQAHDAIEAELVMAAIMGPETANVDWDRM